MTTSSKPTSTSIDRNHSPDHPCPVCGCKSRLELNFNHRSYRFYWHCTSDCAWFSETKKETVINRDTDLSYDEALHVVRKVAHEDAKKFFNSGFDITRQQNIAHEYHNGATIRHACTENGCEFSVDQLLPPNQCNCCDGKSFRTTIISK